MTRPRTFDGFATGAEQPWVLKLFVARGSAVCELAERQLRLIVAEHLPPGSEAIVIDLVDDPEAADEAQIIAAPTLIRERPAPVRRVIGSLADVPKVLASLGWVGPVKIGSVPPG